MKRTALLLLSLVFIPSFTGTSYGDAQEMKRGSLKPIPPAANSGIVARVDPSKPVPGIPIVPPPAAIAAPGPDKGMGAPASGPVPLPAFLARIPGSENRYEIAGADEEARTCVYTGLSSGVSQPVPSSPEYFIAPASWPLWTAVGIRSEPGDDWDIAMYADIGADPACVDSLLAYSILASGVDLVVGDFNYVMARSLYLEASRYAGTEDARIEWDEGWDILYANGGPVFRTTGPDDVVEIWDIYLNAGVEYGILLRWHGPADLRFLLFENPGMSSHYGGRTSAVVDSTYYVTYSPSFSGWRGIAVVNEDGGAGNYWLEVGTCTAPIVLTSGVSQPLMSDWHRFTFYQPDPYWCAFAVRKDQPGIGWHCGAYASGSGESWPWCFTDAVAGGFEFDYEGRSIAFDAMDFNYGGFPPGSYYIAANPGSTEASTARVEWDAGADILDVNSGLAWRTIDSTDVIEIWDVSLDSLNVYNVGIGMTGTAALIPVVYRRDPTYGSSGSMLTCNPTAGASMCESYVSTSAGWHGLAVVNFNGGSGTYALGVSEVYQDAADTLLANPVDGRGASWVDFDGDGDLDLSLANSYAQNRLFVNDGYGNFTNGVPPFLPYPNNYLESHWADYDNDGDPDVLFTSNGGGLSLFRNESGASFTDVTPALFDSNYTGLSASWIDYDNDGLLDLYVANGNGSNLFHGAGDGTFTDVTSGPLVGTWANRGTWADYDDDGDLDLYCVSDGHNHLLRNDGGGTFTDVTTPPLDDPGVGYDAAWGDYSNDGRLDVYVVNASGGPGLSNRLLLNCGGGVFADVTPPILADEGETRGAMWGDLDLDGRLDLVATNFGGPTRLFVNGGVVFYEYFPSPFLVADYTNAAAPGDADGDGDLDLYLTTNSLYGTGINQYIRNDRCSGESWVKVDLTGVVSNRDGIGARIRVYTLQGSHMSTREMNDDGAYFGAGPLVAHFGLGEATEIDSVVVFWPSGIRQTVIGPAPYQTITIVEDVSTSVSGAGGDLAPSVAVLFANVPNPFNPMTTIRFSLPEPGWANLNIYDVGGRLVRALVNEDRLAAGIHEATWDGRNGHGEVSASGVYFYRLETGDATLTRKMALIR